MDRITEAFLAELKKKNLLSQKDIEKFLIKIDRSGEHLEDLLLEHGLPRNEILEAKALALGWLQWIDVSTFTSEPEIAKLIPQSMALRYNILCIGKKDGKLVVAISDPMDAFPLEYVNMRTSYEVTPTLALENDLKLAIEKAYDDTQQSSPILVEAAPSLGVGAKDMVEEASLKEVKRSRTLALEVSSESPQPSALTSHSKLLTIIREISSTLEIDRLLIKLLNASQELCNAEESSILLYDENLNLLYFKCATGEKGESLQKIIVPVSEDSIAGWVALHREPLLINNVKKEPRYYKGIDQLLQFHAQNLICAPIIAGGKLFGVLEAINKSQQGTFTEEEQEYLTLLASHAGVCLANITLLDNFQNYFLHSIEILIAAVEVVEPTFKGHMTNVARLSAAIAKDLGMSGKAYETISYAALLHDIGRLKLTSLSEEQIQKQHPLLAVEMLKEVTLLKDVIPLIKMHHEKFDGSGFPEGLSGNALPLGARILSLVEDFTEWQESNPSKLPVENFVSDRGNHHDPRVVASLQKILLK